MKTKGFTLIELLAVIVILAIIALIATPIILNIINDTRESSNKRSMELYARAVQNAVAHYMMLHPEDNEVTFDDIEEYINYDGAEVSCADRTIKEDGSVALENCTINGKEGYSYGVKTPVCTLSTETYEYKAYSTDVVIAIPSTVEVVTCGTEEFYVIDKTDSTITMLAKYNLGLSEAPYLQSTAMPGDVTTFYYTEASLETDGYTPETKIYSYVSTYGEHLKSIIGDGFMSAGLLTESNLIDYFGCEDTEEWSLSNCSFKFPVVNQSFWTASQPLLSWSSANFHVIWNNNNSWYDSSHDGYDVYSKAGVRPVITISADQVSM